MPKIDEAVWLGWRQRAEEDKRRSGKTDADLAAEVSELVGHDVGRALVNHWFRGRRDPSLAEFVALCAALGSDLGHVLLNIRMTYKQLEGAPETAQALRLHAPTPDYLKHSAKRLKRSKPARTSKTVKVRRVKISG